MRQYPALSYSRIAPAAARPDKCCAILLDIGRREVAGAVFVRIPLVQVRRQQFDQLMTRRRDLVRPRDAQRHLPLPAGRSVSICSWITLRSCSGCETIEKLSFVPPVPCTVTVP